MNNIKIKVTNIKSNIKSKMNKKLFLWIFIVIEDYPISNIISLEMLLQENNFYKKTTVAGQFVQ